jgi:hypothetical protein
MVYVIVRYRANSCLFLPNGIDEFRCLGLRVSGIINGNAREPACT